MNWLQFEALLCCTVSDREQKNIYPSENVADYYSKRFLNKMTTHMSFRAFFLY